MFLPLYHSQMDTTANCNGSRRFLQVFQVGAGSQNFGSSPAAFPVHEQGSGLEVEQPGHQPLTKRNGGAAWSGISQLSFHSGPQV